MNEGGEGTWQMLQVKTHAHPMGSANQEENITVGSLTPRAGKLASVSDNLCNPTHRWYYGVF